nr:unnamed protein product [Naegleria fowleri]
MGGIFSSMKDKEEKENLPQNNNNNNNTSQQNGSSHNTTSAEKKNSVSVLLLGTGETGKSTLFKQIELINGVGIIKDHERSMWASLIHGNLISDMKTLINIVEELNTEINDETNDILQEILELPDQNVTITDDLREKLKRLWNCDAIKHAYENRDQALDSAEYLYSNIDRIAKPDYSPTVDDVLHCRVKTLGVHQVEIVMEGGIKFRLVDVGGQRAERRKWLELMSEVDAVIFMTSLAEYDQDCYEEKGCWRVKESLETFEKVVNNKLFQNVPFILMLNKSDLFERKLEKKSFKKYFPEFNGNEKDVKECTDYLAKLFLAKCKERSSSSVLVQPHCAIDKNATEKMLQQVKNFVLNAKNN